MHAMYNYVRNTVDWNRYLFPHPTRYRLKTRKTLFSLLSLTTGPFFCSARCQVKLLVYNDFENNENNYYTSSTIKPRAIYKANNYKDVGKTTAI